MKRVLLLYLFERSGHHRASLALQKGFSIAAPGIETCVENPLRSISPTLAARIEALYFGILRRAPALWDLVYDRAWAVTLFRGLRPIWAGRAAAGPNAMMERFSPDAVVCTQAFAAMLCSEYRRRSGKAFPLAAVMTDFEPHRFWPECGADLFTTPDARAASMLEMRGIARERIRIAGIPVDPGFGPTSSLERRAALRVKLGFKPRLASVLVSGGSRGFLRWEAMLDALDAAERDFQIVLIVGCAEEARRRAERRAARLAKPVWVRGYVDNFEEHLMASDVFVTKPGGMACAEALACGVPTVLVQPLPGQERRNALALRSERTIHFARTAAEAAALVVRLLSSPRAGPVTSEELTGGAGPCRNAAIEIPRLVSEMIA